MVVAGFEPLDILAGLLRLVELIRDGTPRVENLYPRCVTREGNLAAQEQLWKVFRPLGGRWRGIAHVPNGNLRLQDAWAHLDARRRFDIDIKALWDFAPPSLIQQCICGEIMSGRESPTSCRLFGKECQPETPGRGVHGLHRGHLPDLAPVRRTSAARPDCRGSRPMRPILPLGTTVSLKHGAGGRAMRALIEQLFAEGPAQPPGAVGLAGDG